MTGYSSAQREEGGFRIGVSLKSLNHRFLDIQTRLSPGAEPLEPRLRRAIKEKVARGHVEAVVSVERLGAFEAPVDERVLEGYLAACRRLEDRFHLTTEPDVAALLRLPGVISSRNGNWTPEEMIRVEQLLAAALDESLAALNEARTSEGESLERDIRARLGHVQEDCRAMLGLAERAPAALRQRLDERLREMMATPSLDEGRLAQEVALLATRSDITEELTRLESHLGQAAKLLDEGNEAGKKLDFLLQEMNREANTILSKTTDVPEVGMELGRHAMTIKAEIEKLREQAQNIE